MWDYGAGNRGPELAAISIVMASVSVVAVALRSYTMATILKRFLIEDWLAVLTCAFQVGFCVVVVVGVSFGLGAHVDDVPEVNRHKALIFKWAGQVAYVLVSTLVKFAIGIFLLRLCVNNNWQRVTIIILLVVVGLFNIFYLFMAIFQCQPAEFYWWRYTPNPPVTGKCNGHALATIPTYFAFFIGIFSDLTLALLPATLIKGAHLDRRTKISVCCVLALGSLASVATIARIPYAKQLLSNPDYLYNFTDLAIWSIVECGIAITASSLATLRPLFVKLNLLATSRFTSRYASRVGSAGLPIQSANTVTIISTSRASRNSRRNTVLSGTTALTGTTGLSGASSTGGLASVKEGQDGGIWVEKDIEMSVITRDGSQDSIDRLEAEVNEVIQPGSARRKASQDALSHASSSRRNSLAASLMGGGRPRPPPLQTSFPPSPAIPPSFSNGPSAVESASSSSGGGRRYLSRNPSTPSSPQQQYPYSAAAAAAAAARTTPGSPFMPYGVIGSAYTDNTSRPLSPAYDHHRTYSGGAASRSFSPPSFHLPTRLQHQSATGSARSESSFGEVRATSGPGSDAGLSAPPRMLQASIGGYIPGDPSASPGGPLGPPISLHHHRPNRSLGSSPGLGYGTSPMMSPPSPFFQRYRPSIPEGPGRSRSQHGANGGDGGDDDDESSRSSLVDRRGRAELDGLGPQSPRSPRSPGSPTAQEMHSPLGSHPPLSPRGGWV